jgi:hypothetical protein
MSANTLSGCLPQHRFRSAAQGKKELKGRNDVLVEVAPIIDDDIEPAIFGRQSCQGRRIRLITLPYLDAVLAQVALIV